MVNRFSGDAAIYTPERHMTELWQLLNFIVLLAALR
jgi:hypothetical protein